MAGETEYSLGLDLAPGAWRAAIAHSGGVELVPAEDDRTAHAQLIATMVARLSEGRGSAPATVVLSATPDQTATVRALADDVAALLGFETRRVRVIDQMAAADLGTPFARSDRSDVKDAAVAIGAAISGLTDEDRARVAVIAAGAGGGVAGVAGAVALGGGSPAAAASALGPMGVPLGAGAPVGPAGVAFDAGAIGGPAGVPLGHGLAGPTGVPVGGGASGPVGTPMGAAAGVGPAGGPMARAGGIVRRHPVGAIVGSIVALTIVAGTVVAASGGGSSAPSAVPPSVATVDQVTTPATEPVIALVPVTDAVVATVEPIAPTSAPTTVEPVIEAVAAACTVGTWTADNDTIAGVYTDAFTQLGFALDGVTGTVQLQIGPDGTVVTTYDNFVIAAVLPAGAGNATVAINGVDTNTIVFADDGTFTVTATEINSTMKASSGPIVLVDGQSPDTMFRGTGPYTCTEGQLDMVITASIQFNVTFTRGG